ncbi:MAG: hypothetical protein ACYS9C_07750 [Planctomycetota bacterium]
MPGTGADLKIRKKARYKKLICWLLVDLTVAAVVFALLLYTPGLYKPSGNNPTSYKKGQVHPYLTHLSSELYNGAQRSEPFELVVTQNGINEIITWSRWPKESEGIMFSAPTVLFVPGSIVLMGTAHIKGVEFVVTIALESRVDEQGLLNLQVAKVKIGAMNITPLAKMMAKKMYAQRLAAIPIDTEALTTKIAGALLNNEPFEPVLPVENKKVRVEKITVAEEKLTLHLVPAS